MITSIKWSPNGDVFAVGSFEMLRLCDKSGWSHSFDKPASGSLLSLSWSHDGTVVCGAGGNGSVTFGYIVDRQLQWSNVEAILDADNRVNVIDPMHGINEDLEFSNRVVNMSMCFSNIIVCTTNQCFVYNIMQQNWASPFVFDVKDSV